VGRLGDDISTMPRHAGVKIRFIGVYDTVGALGVPLSVATEVNEPIIGFHDTTLGDMVEHAVQALAVDEKRGPYMPTLWTQAANAAALAGQSVLQVWFPGVHSDIGGGYGNKGIGDITLDFMMRITKNPPSKIRTATIPQRLSNPIAVWLSTGHL